MKHCSCKKLAASVLAAFLCIPILGSAPILAQDDEDPLFLTPDEEDPVTDGTPSPVQAENTKAFLHNRGIGISAADTTFLTIAGQTVDGDIYTQTLELKEDTITFENISNCLDLNSAIIILGYMQNGQAHEVTSVYMKGKASVFAEAVAEDENTAVFRIYADDVLLSEACINLSPSENPAQDEPAVPVFPDTPSPQNNSGEESNSSMDESSTPSSNKGASGSGNFYQKNETPVPKTAQASSNKIQEAAKKAEPANKDKKTAVSSKTDSSKKTESSTDSSSAKKEGTTVSEDLNKKATEKAAPVSTGNNCLILFAVCGSICAVLGCAGGLYYRKKANRC